MRILVVDDEPLARERLIRLINDSPDYEYCGEAANGEEAITQVQQAQPDVVLMDIRMPGIDGLQAARWVAQLEHPPAVIFTTAYGDHALEAFDALAIGYLLKPIRRERLEAALQAASRTTRAQLSAAALSSAQEGPRSHLCSRVGDALTLVPVADIVYLMAEHKYVTVCYLGGETLIEESLKNLEIEFGERFLRIHRNALVAKRYISGLSKASDGRPQIRLDRTDALLEISRRHLPNVRRYLTSLGRH